MLVYVGAFALGGAFVFAVTFVGVLFVNARLLQKELNNRRSDAKKATIAGAEPAPESEQQRVATLDWETALMRGGARRNARAAVVSVTACGFCLTVAMVAASVERLADLAPQRIAPSCAPAKVHR